MIYVEILWSKLIAGRRQILKENDFLVENTACPLLIYFYSSTQTYPKKDIPNVSKSHIASVHFQCPLMLKPYLSILFKKKDFSNMILTPHLFLREQECLWISQHVSISLLERFSSLSLFISSSKIPVCPGATKWNENKFTSDV